MPRTLLITKIFFAHIANLCLFSEIRYICQNLGVKEDVVFKGLKLIYDQIRRPTPPTFNIFICCSFLVLCFVFILVTNDNSPLGRSRECSSLPSVKFGCKYGFATRTSSTSIFKRNTVTLLDMLFHGLS